jgi:hypothetical protein
MQITRPAGEVNPQMRAPLFVLVSFVLCVIPTVAEGPWIFLNACQRTLNHGACAKYFTRSVVRVKSSGVVKGPGSLGYARDDTKMGRLN